MMLLTESRCVQFTIRGYNDKQHILLQKLMDKMMTLEINEQRFEILMEKVTIVCIVCVKSFYRKLCS